MEHHLSGEELARYRDRELEPAELVAADAHLGECGDCSRALSELAAPADLLSAVRAARGEHLSYEQMDAWVEETLDSTQRELVMAHIGLCEPCARQLQAYESYAPAMAARIPPAAREISSVGHRLRAFFQSPRFTVVAMAALVLVLLSPLVMKKETAPGQNESPASLRPQSLRDLPVNLDPALLYPVSEAIEERQPILEWLESGEKSVIFVLDAARKEVAHSDLLAGTHWLVPLPLDRGAVYSWEVRTAAGTKQALFRVLGEADRQKLAQARLSGADHLTIGGMARDMGVLSEAQRQYEAQVKLEPGDVSAATLLDQIKRIRGR